MTARHGRRRSIRTTARDHRLILGLLALALALRIVVTVTYQPALFFTGDSVGYLDNSAHLVPGDARPILYAIFLRVVLSVHRLILVPILQHIFGLVTALVTYALLRHLELKKGIAVLGTLFVLFDPLQLVIEEHILSESLFELLVVSALALLVWRQRPSILQCVLVGLGIAGATVTRDVGLVLIVPVLGFAFLRRFGWKQISALILAMAIPLVAYASWFDTTYNHFALQNFTGRFLYGRVAPFADCKGLHLSAEEHALCPTLTPRNPWPSLYVWGTPSPFNHPPIGGNPDANQIALNFSLTIIRHQPLAYAAAVTDDFLDFFKPARSTGPDADPVAVDFPFRLNSLTAYPSPDIDQWIKRADASPTAHPVIVRPLAQGLIDWQRVFYFPGPVFALALLASFAGAIGRPKSTNIKRRLGAESLLYGMSAFLLMLAPVATVVFDYRHMEPAFPLLGTGGALGGAILVERFWHPKHRHSSPFVTDPATPSGAEPSAVPSEASGPAVPSEASGQRYSDDPRAIDLSMTDQAPAGQFSSDSDGA